MKSWMVVLMWMGCSAQANWNAEIGIQNARMLYRAVSKNPDVVILEQTLADIPISQTMNAKTVLRTDIRVPGVDAEKGHSRITLLKLSETSVLLKVDKMSYESGVANPLVFDAMAVIDYGTWTDFTRGRVIRLTLTPEGKKASHLAMEAYIKRNLAFETDLKTKGSPAHIQFLDFKLEMSSISGTLNRMMQRLNQSVQFEVRTF